MLFVPLSHMLAGPFFTMNWPAPLSVIVSVTKLWSRVEYRKDPEALRAPQIDPRLLSVVLSASGKTRIVTMLPRHGSAHPFLVRRLGQGRDR